jgi:hypothetical protein
MKMRGTITETTATENNGFSAPRDDEVGAADEHNASDTVNECSFDSNTSMHLLSPPHKPLVLRVFHSIEFIAIVASLRLAGTQIVPLFLTPIQNVPLLNLVLRLYIALFCIGICLVEFEVPVPLILLSQSYLIRGFLYTFLSLVAMNDATFEGQLELIRDVQSVPWVAFFTELTAWPIFVVGHVYIVLGVCCAKPYRDRLTKTYREELNEFQEAIMESNEEVDGELSKE